VKLIPAFLKNEPLLELMDALLTSDRLHIWWLGQSGFLVQWQGQRALLDPYLSDSLTEKYAHTDKPHVRMSEQVVDPRLLRKITVVSSSHNHTDHLDAATLLPILAHNPGVMFIIPEANRSFVAARLHCTPQLPIGLNDGQSVRTGVFTFHGVPASHNEIERDELGNCRYMGYVLEAGPHRIYHSGDTLWYDEIVATVGKFKPTIALLPINGNDPARQVAGNLDPFEAAKLAHDLGVNTVIPCHYDMFLFNTADVNEFRRAAVALGQPFVVLKGGEMFTA